MPLKAGDTAPDFTLTTDTDEQLTLSTIRGRVVVLFFYPKDDTPG
jgi:peroxiredoxin Q/BCP